MTMTHAMTRSRDDRVCASVLTPRPSRASAADFTPTCDARIHELADAIAATVIGAYAGSNWLRAEPPNLEEIRLALDGIAKDGKRAYDMVVELRALMTERVHGG
jgi:hypothetical protein